MENKIMNKLLEGYDWYMRRVSEQRKLRLNDEELCSITDVYGQMILDIGKILGEVLLPVKKGEYKFEAYKRIMQFTSVENYMKDYPKPFKAKV